MVITEDFLISAFALRGVQAVSCLILHLCSTLSVSLDRRMESSQIVLEHLSAFDNTAEKGGVTQELISQSWRSSAAMNIFLVLSSL